MTYPVFQDYHHASRVSHVSSLPHPRSYHGRYVDENPVVHFFRNIVSPRTTPPLQAKGRGLSFSRFSWGGETHRPGYGSGKFYEHKYAHKGHKGYRYDGQGSLSKFFKLEGCKMNKEQVAVLPILLQETELQGGSSSRPGSRSGSPVARR